MQKKTLLMTLWLLTNIFCNSQINFNQNNNISVYKNGQELENAWAGGLNFCQFSKIDLDLDGVNDLFIFDKRSWFTADYAVHIKVYQRTIF